MEEARCDARVAELTAALAVLATLLLIALPVGQGDRPLPWWVLAAAFAAGELVVVHLQVRRESVTQSFGEVPMVLGLAYTEPRGFVLASVLGSVAVLVLHRRQRGLKLAFNAVLFTVEAALAAVVYQLVVGGSGPAQVRAGAATLLAVLVAALASALAITAVITLSTGRVDREPLQEAAGSGLVGAVANASFGLLVVVLLEQAPVALVLLSVVFLVLVTVYRAYAKLERGHARLQLLYGFTRSVAGQPDARLVAGRVLSEARDVLQSDTAVLLSCDADQVPQQHLQLRGADRRVVERAPEVQDAAWWQAALARPLRLSRDGSGAQELRALGVPDAVAVPLQAAGQVLGVLCVGGRMSHLPNYDEQDVRLLQSLADHAAIALRGGRLVDELRSQAREREHEALHDAATGLPNRRALVERLGRQLSAGRTVGVLVLDLSGFGQINEAFGYATGTRLLVAVGQRLVDGCGAERVARLGNDEFAVLLSARADCTGEDALCERAAEVLAALEGVLPVDELSIDVHAHAGLAIGPRHGDDPQELLRYADSAMTQAKAGGRALQVYDLGGDHGSARRLRIVADLRSALAEQDLSVAYQPKTEPRSGRTVGAEALVRWEHPVLGSLPPDEFIPLAEHAGLIGRLTEFVLATALAECAAWRAAGHELSVAVNLSVRSLTDPALPGRVREALSDAGLPPEYLTLEITEESVMQDVHTSVQVLRDLRASGVRLSVDDFGSGQSSLAYLKHLPVHEMKIDRAFVQGMTSSRSDAAIVAAAVELGHALDLVVIAEGVEDEPTKRLLLDLGVDVVQGYLMSRPLPPERFRQWLVDAIVPPTRFPVAAVPALSGGRPPRA